MSYAGMEPPPPYSAQPGPNIPTAVPGYPITTTVYPTVTTTTVIVREAFGPYPMEMMCSNCQANIMTETNATPGLLTWLLSGTLILVGCWFGCCLLPLAISECKDIEHRCPNCKTHLGTFRRL